MQARWIELFEPEQKSVDDNRLYVGRLIEMFGDLLVAAWGKRESAQFPNTRWRKVRARKDPLAAATAAASRSPPRRARPMIYNGVHVDAVVVHVTSTEAISVVG